ncbi:MAG: hypothetical protein KDJ27_20795, partial [Gammaproteobacteria bacterium]|nr:hypothetical protein [Gammaproteobacteria bacterium]
MSRFEDLTVNLKTGFRFATGRTIDREAFRVSLTQGLWLITLLVLLELIVSYVATSSPTAFNPYGFSASLAMTLIGTLGMVALALMIGTPQRQALQLLIANLAASPVLVIYGNLLQDESFFFEHPTLGLAFGLLALLWGAFVTWRLFRVFCDTSRRVAIGLTVLLMVGVVSLLDRVIPQETVWFAGEPETSGDPILDALWKLDVEELYYRQYDMVQDRLASMREHSIDSTDLYLLAFAGYGTENVFLNEVEYVKALFDERYGTRDRSMILANNLQSLDAHPAANLNNLRHALHGVAGKMDLEQDVMFLFLTSHGSVKHGLAVELGPMKFNDISNKDLRNALDESGIKWRVIVVSSCYSGGFVDTLKNPQTLIITAAAHDRTSFGCGRGSQFTDFGTAYFKQALVEQSDFIRGFDIAADHIESKESASGSEHSLPQRFVGSEIANKLLELQVPQSKQSALSVPDIVDPRG